MFAGVSHSYAAQVVSLWLSFLPGLAMAALILGAWFERISRRSHAGLKRPV